MRQSQLFTKTLKEVPHDEVSRNADLLIRGGFADKLMAGVYTYLPMGLRVLEKIERVIREEMNAIDGQEVLLPALHPKENWDATGRWDLVDVLFKLTGSGDKPYALGATHEEIVTPLVKKFVASYKDLPLSVYQIQTKFRNEPRAKSGLMRGREFRMKDMYSFHRSAEDLDAYYERAASAYMRIYERCGIGDITYKTFASGGAFSKYSHEFQTVTDVGEDVIYLCEKCRLGVNREIIEEQRSCPSCGYSSLIERKAIEVGNIFKLMTRFSEPFGLSYADEHGAQNLVIMGTYGVGSTRLMGVIAEIHHDERGILWPKEIAPFSVHLVSLCQEDSDILSADAVYRALIEKGVETLYDDRRCARAGEKFADSDLIGIPLRAVISPKTIAQGVVEVKKRNEKEARMLSQEAFYDVI